MTTIELCPRTQRSRWAILAMAVGLIGVLTGCSGLASPLAPNVEASPSPTTSAGENEPAEPELTPAQQAASECVVGMWQMDNSTMSALLVQADLLVSDSIEGTALLAMNSDGTAKVEYIGWTYVVKAPPNPMLGGQAPTTTTITVDSSTTATYGIDETGLITVSPEDDGSSAAANTSPFMLTCEGDRLVEKVESMDGEIVYHRRG